MFKKAVLSAMLLTLGQAHAQEVLVKSQDNGTQTVLTALVKDPLAKGLNVDTAVFKDLALFEGDETSCKYFQDPINAYICIESNTVYTEAYLIEQYSECSLKYPGKCQPKDLLPTPKGVLDWIGCIMETGYAGGEAAACAAAVSNPATAPVAAAGICGWAVANVETARRVCGGT